MSRRFTLNGMAEKRQIAPGNLPYSVSAAIMVADLCSLLYDSQGGDLNSV